MFRSDRRTWVARRGLEFQERKSELIENEYKSPKDSRWIKRLASRNWLPRVEGRDIEKSHNSRYLFI